jgi:ABC-type glycerol-3-phosphate transport system substrate-binding protein
MKKCLAFIIACALVVSCASCGAKKQDETAKGPVTYESAMDSLKDKAKGKEVICWYTDDTDKEWIEAAAKNFNKKYGVNVKPVAYDGVQLFEDINSANQKENGPDMYICGNDLLEFAKTAGVLSENDILDDEFWDKNYPKTSVNALTYKGKRYGYPVYFDTYCLVYDANLWKMHLRQLMIYLHSLMNMRIPVQLRRYFVGTLQIHILIRCFLLPMRISLEKTVMI